MPPVSPDAVTQMARISPVSVCSPTTGTPPAHTHPKERVWVGVGGKGEKSGVFRILEGEKRLGRNVKVRKKGRERVWRIEE